MLSGNDGLIKSSSAFILLATSSTFDLVCLTIPNPIALLLLALRNPRSDSGPISTFATSERYTLESP